MSTDATTVDPVQALVRDGAYREAQRQALAEHNAKRCAVIRAASIEPLWRTEVAHFGVKPPVDTDFDDENSHAYRITELRAKVTHFLGDSRHEEPHLEVEFFGHRLTTKGELSQSVDPHWMYLPAELAAELLGRAMVA